METPPLIRNDRFTGQQYDFSLGAGLMAFTTFRWASTIIQEAGHKPSQQLGTVFGIAVCFSIALLMIDYLLWRLRFFKAVRSGLWGGGAVGSYAGLVAGAELAHPVWSQVVGLVSTILFFVVFYYLEQRFQDKPKQP